MLVIDFYGGNMVFLYVIIGIILLILTVSFFSYFVAYYSPSKRKVHSIPHLDGSKQSEDGKKHIKELISYVNSLEFEEIYIKSYDGTSLYGRYYHTKDGAPLQILFHGYRGGAIRDFCGGLLLALKSGFNVILVDERSHGKSDGNTITFGIKERRDAFCWVKYANNRFGDTCPIILTGISMGGATVLMASDLDLPENVVGIIADCPYSSPKEIIMHFCGSFKIPPKLIYPFTYLGALIFGRFNLHGASAYKSVQNTNIPILIIHGENDSLVPCSMSNKIFDVCKSEKKFLHTFKDAEHGMSYIVDNEKYESAYNDFVALCLNKE